MVVRVVEGLAHGVNASIRPTFIVHIGGRRLQLISISFSTLSCSITLEMTRTINTFNPQTEPGAVGSMTIQGTAVDAVNATAPGQDIANQPVSTPHPNERIEPMGAASRQRELPYWYSSTIVPGLEGYLYLSFDQITRIAQACVEAQNAGPMDYATYPRRSARIAEKRYHQTWM
ncbi:hypothetical protein D9613_004615 [Agrocybe pediades]|uniref:Uncharacterized protein n=1 Tax=Agrocybe pediades TaxID=84607 RepID=A0A8H4VL36_9AGAR|nr:hypothetical protein D9613_004615 [Agrocybe pediades]